MARVVLYVFLVTCAMSAMALTIVPTEFVELTDSDRAYLEKIACRKPLKVSAQRIHGWRMTLNTHGALHAGVTCEPHVTTETYSLQFSMACTKRWGSWRCESQGDALRMQFMGGGPYDIGIAGLTPEEAIKGLSCLEAGLRQRPDLAGAEMMSVAPSMLIPRSAPEGTTVIDAWLSTPVKACLSVSFARNCDVNGQVPLEVENDECLDDF